MDAQNALYAWTLFEAAIAIESEFNRHWEIINFSRRLYNAVNYFGSVI